MAEVFHIVPATGRGTWPLLMALLVTVLGGGLVLIGVSMRGSKHATFEVSPTGLQIKGDLYGRRLPASTLRGGAARVVDLTPRSALRLLTPALAQGLVVALGTRRADRRYQIAERKESA